MKMDRRASVFLLLAFTILLHGRSLGVPFFWDDLAIISENQRYQDNPASVLSTPIISAESGYYRPVPFILLGIVGKAAGFQNPVPMHLVTLLFVCFAALLFFALASRFFTIPISLLVSLIFIAFPTNVEAFAWLSAFPDVLVLVFSLLYIRYFIDDIERPYPSLRMGLVLLLGLLSKESAFVLLPFTLLVDGAAIVNKPFKRIVQFHLPLWLLFGAYFLLHRYFAPGIPGLAYSAPLVLKTFAAYAQKIVTPWPLLVLIGDRTGNFDLQSLAGLVLLLVAAYGIFFSTSRVMRIAIAIGVCSFIPYSNFWIYKGECGIAERYMLLMVASVSLMGGVVLTKVLSPIRYVVALGLVLIYFGSSWLQYGAWENERQLWVDVAHASPGKYTPYSKLAELDVQNGDYESAAKNLETYVKNMRLVAAFGYTFSDHVFVNLASLGQKIYFHLGDYDKALTFARSMYKVKPSAPLLIGAMQIHDLRLDYASAASAAVKGVELYPGDGPMSSEALKLTVLGGKKDATEKILAQSTYAEAASVAAYYNRMYATMATLPVFVRGGIFLDLHIYSLAFKEFDSITSELTAEQAYVIGRSAYQERLWASSLRYFDLAANLDKKTEFQIWRGMVLQRLQKTDDACLVFKGALLTATPDERDRILSFSSNCSLLNPVIEPQ